MRTFPGHQDRHALHGITVVVETDGPELWIGRCDDIDDAGVVLRDADVHGEGAGERPREEWLASARQVGVWPRYPRVVVPASRVSAVRRLAES